MTTAGTTTNGSAVRTPEPSRHPADRLVRAIERTAAPVCIGLDPVVARLPDELRNAVDERDPSASAAAIEVFSSAVLDAVAAHVPAVKFQSACYERYREHGVAALYRLMDKARQAGLMVIYDGKRGDIGISAEHYAAAVNRHADWVTVNSYLGVDSVRPFVDPGMGVFVLVRTSNPSASALQETTTADGRTVAEVASAQFSELAESSMGDCGYSAVGAVVGASDCDAAAKLRSISRGQMLLVPGYGAQGGGVDDVLPCFENGGRGAIVSASRSVIYAFDQSDAKWQRSIASAAQEFAQKVGAASGWR